MQGHMFPSLASRVPDMVERIWAAADRYWADPKHTHLRQLELAALVPCDVRTIQRCRERHPDLVPWPIVRGMRRPWLSEPTPAAVPEEAPALTQLAFGLAEDGDVVAYLNGWPVSVLVDGHGGVHVRNTT